MKARKRGARRRHAQSRAGRRRVHRWSAAVTAHSDALDLHEGTFAGSPHAVATALRDAAEASTRRKTSPCRSAMSMLTFFINRGGRGLPAAQRQRLEQAKDELRRLYGREPARRRRA